MSKIKPFRAFIYNPQKFRDYSRVVCPPYDIISPAAKEHYHKLNPHNFIHVLLGKDIPGEDKYARAGESFRKWLAENVLIRDENPALYFYSQEYNLKGERRRRLGFIGLLKLEEKNPSVFGHEHTRLEPKEDRLKLIREVRANLSPIFVIFSDKRRIIQYIYQHHIRKEEPFISLTDEEKTLHNLWRVDTPELLLRAQDAMDGENIFIADGHHRYEVACAYRQELIRRYGTITGEEDFNYVLAYFTNPEPKGLAILPIHRLVKLGVKMQWGPFMTALREYFDVEEIKDKIRFFFLLEKAGCREHVIGMYNTSRYWLLRLKNIKILDKLMHDKPREYRSLDVSILNSIVLKNVLGFGFDDKEAISFHPDAGELIEKVDNDPSCVAFFLNPIKMQDIISVALAGEKMPPKSTYFYPKVLSGLVINKFD